jgi:hypothetical protein
VSELKELYFYDDFKIEQAKLKIINAGNIEIREKIFIMNALLHSYYQRTSDEDFNLKSDDYFFPRAIGADEALVFNKRHVKKLKMIYRYLKMSMASTYNTFIICKHNQTIIGVAHLKINPILRSASGKLSFVSEEFRNKGVHSLMHSKLMDITLESDLQIETFNWIVPINNEAALSWSNNIDDTTETHIGFTTKLST